MFSPGFWKILGIPLRTSQLEFLPRFWDTSFCKSEIELIFLLFIERILSPGFKPDNSAGELGITSWIVISEMFFSKIEIFTKNIIIKGNKKFINEPEKIIINLSK